MKNWIISLLLVFKFSYIASQINFVSIPIDKQLYGRNIENNMGVIEIEGNVINGDNYTLTYSSWILSEPNNSGPGTENAAEIINSTGLWNDADEGVGKPSYVEYDGLINTLGNFIYIGQYNGHTYFKNSNNLNWQHLQTSCEICLKPPI